MFVDHITWVFLVACLTFILNLLVKDCDFRIGTSAISFVLFGLLAFEFMNVELWHCCCDARPSGRYCVIEVYQEQGLALLCSLFSVLSALRVVYCSAMVWYQNSVTVGKALSK